MKGFGKGLLKIGVAVGGLGFGYCFEDAVVIAILLTIALGALVSIGEIVVWLSGSRASQATVLALIVAAIFGSFGDGDSSNGGGCG